MEPPLSGRNSDKTVATHHYGGEAVSLPLARCMIQDKLGPLYAQGWVSTSSRFASGLDGVDGLLSPRPAAGMFAREVPPGRGGTGPAPRETSRCRHLRVPATAVTARGRQRPCSSQPAPMASLTTWKWAASRKRDCRYRLAGGQELREGRGVPTGGTAREPIGDSESLLSLGANCYPRAAQGSLHPHVFPAHLH